MTTREEYREAATGARLMAQARRGKELRCSEQGRRFEAATAAAEAEVLELAAEVLSALASGEKVLVPKEPTEAMVRAYLDANTAYWRRADELPRSPFTKWRQGTPPEATVEGYAAMIAAAGEQS